MTDPQFRQVRIPEELCVNLEKKFGNRSGNLEYLIVDILKALLEDRVEPLDRAVQELIEQRLKDLGYI